MSYSVIRMTTTVIINNVEKEVQVFPYKCPYFDKNRNKNMTKILT